MNAIQQFYELVAARYHEIERLKSEAKELGEVIFNITAAYVAGEISAEDYYDLTARATAGESETR